MIADGTVEDSIIFEKYAEEDWRGITLINVSNETSFNYVRISGANKIDGAGMYLEGSNPILSHVIISNNISDSYGGGVYLLYSDPAFTNVSIVHNTSYLGGGGVFFDYSNPTLNNVIIRENVSGAGGGGMYVYKSDPTLMGVTIADNTANSGGGMYLGYDSHPTLTNSILWNNSQELIYFYSGSPLHLVLVYYQLLARCIAS